MHSSRMRAARFLNVVSAGVGGGCSASRGEGSATREKGWVGQTPSPVNRMTDRCKNITLPQTSFAGGKYPEVSNYKFVGYPGWREGGGC